jgi:hypothetical protein
MGGFIIGFDSDPPDIFQRQVQFIQKTGIVTAMIGLLTAVPGTRLYKRLEQEGRLLFKATGSNTDVSGSLNFVTKMDRETIIRGYKWVMNTIYSPDMYYKRIITFLQQYRPRTKFYLEKNDVLTFFRSFWYLGITDRMHCKNYFWRLLTKGTTKYRNALSEIVTFALYGYHFRNLFWSAKFKSDIGK